MSRALLSVQTTAYITRSRVPNFPNQSIVFRDPNVNNKKTLLLADLAFLMQQKGMEFLGVGVCNGHHVILILTLPYVFTCLCSWIRSLCHLVFDVGWSFHYWQCIYSQRRFPQFNHSLLHERHRSYSRRYAIILFTDPHWLLVHSSCVYYFHFFLVLCCIVLCTFPHESVNQSINQLFLLCINPTRRAKSECTLS